MKSHLWRSAAVAVAVLLFASQTANQALAQYYNVDNQTLPNGPIQLQDPTISPFAGGVTLSGYAVDLSSTTYYNVKFLSEFVFDPITDLTYSGADQWAAGDGSSWLQITFDGFLAPNQVSGLPTTWNSTMFPSDPPAMVAPTAELPYVNIGTVVPGAPVPFSVTFADNLPNFDYIASFVSTTPVPEPSSIVLASIAAIGGLFFIRRRNAVQAA
jgi:PEP-CTERM motif